MLDAGHIAVAGILLTFAIFIANVIYRTGHLAARVEELERWRGSMRIDMHEVSEKLEELTANVKHLSTLIEERTEKYRRPAQQHRET